MAYRILRDILRETDRGRFLPLLITLLLYLALIPIVDQFVHLAILVDIFFSLILLAAINAVSEKRHQTLIALALGAPMFVGLWLNRFFAIEWLKISSHITVLFFFGYAIYRLLALIFTESRVTRNVIYAAIIVYLLMGVWWADIYVLLNHLDPGTFDIGHVRTDSPNLVLLYYSYVTLTTLGYGDISPQTDLGYSLAIMEAIIGQLYLTVLVARLVGLHIAQFGSGGPKDQG